MVREIKVIEHGYITLSDGIRLAFKIWMPTDAEDRPVPAILEYLPYRKRDGTARRDEINHPYLASHGYGCIRVDIRGSGESEGLLTDEYTLQEQKDGIEVLDWLAQQTWCDGKIGMMGISWGGFNALQIAAHSPKNLHAVMSVCSTNNRYTDDIHWMGGSLLTDNFQWAAVMWAMMSRAPDPLLVGDRWREMWLDRLNQQPFLAMEWLKHSAYDDYWKQGSICENPENIKCPVYLVGGFADGYPNTIPDMLETLTCARKGLIGPWKHMYPNLSGEPGPSIGFLTELLRWFDYWLKNIDTGIMDEPMYRVWMQESIKPNPAPKIRPGRWVAEETVPSKNIQLTAMFFHQDKKLAFEPSEIQGQCIIQDVSPQSVGLNAGAWCGYGMSPEKPDNQREDDGGSICFDSEPLEESVEILGRTQVHLDLMVDQPEAFIAVRLNEVSPDGSSLLLAYGILNLKFINGFEKEEPITPNKRMSVTLELKNTASQIKKGNRIRIAISTTYWPLVFPSPHPVLLSIFPNTSKLVLPIRPPREEDVHLPLFSEPDGAPPLNVIYYRPALGTRSIHRDIGSGTITYTVVEDSGDSLMVPIDLRTDYKQIETYTIKNDDPCSATVEIKTSITLSRKNWITRTELSSKMTVDTQSYFLEAKLEAYHGEKQVCVRQVQETVPRNNNMQKETESLYSPLNFFPPPDKSVVQNAILKETKKNLI